MTSGFHNAKRWISSGEERYFEKIVIPVSRKINRSSFMTVFVPTD